jgi:hypothetical protein
MKLLAYWILDPTKVPLLARKPLDLIPQTAQRAYQLYEQHGHQNGHATQNWLQAEQDIRKEDSQK